jgi:oxygen-independent coproporphyrinogen-3 oxidase
MAGIYLHIPFCKQACHYCDFHFSTSLKYKDEMLSALHQELVLQKDYLAGSEIESIYFGGGTPSLLKSAEIQSLTDYIKKIYAVNTGVEITLEVNPDDLGGQNVKKLRETDINRLSIGAQSFFEEDLRWMNRAHTAVEALGSVKRAQDSGLENITLDLIYGYPLLTDEKWKANIQTVINLKVPHVSAYGITVEPKTALASFIRKGTQEAMKDAQGASQFLLLSEQLQNAGFEHYEISNFAMGKRYSRHNSNYWKGVAYLGIGPSAHSFNTKTRQWNISDNMKYLESINQKIIPAETEVLSVANQLNEYIMTSIRTMWGMDLNKIQQDFGQDFRDTIERSVQKFLNKNQVSKQGDIITLTTEGKLFADQIAAALFFEPSP